LEETWCANKEEPQDSRRFLKALHDFLKDGVGFLGDYGDYKVPTVPGTLSVRTLVPR
jgi:hypothetical protein